MAPRGMKVMQMLQRLLYKFKEQGEVVEVQAQEVGVLAQAAVVLQKHIEI